MKWACLTALLFAAALLRLGTAWARYGDAAFSTGDEQGYWVRGEALARLDGGYSHFFAEPGEEAYRAGLYPGFIALLDRFGPPEAGRVRVAQAVLGCVTAFLLFFLGSSVHSPLAGLAAAALLAFNSVQIAVCADLNVHSFDTFLVLLTVCALARWLKSPTPRMTAALGLSLGAALACRSTLVALPLLPLLLIARLRPDAGSKRKLALILLASAALPLVPWTARNALRLGEFVPFERGAPVFNLFTASLGLDRTVEVQEAYRLAEAREPDLRGRAGVQHVARMRRMALANIAAAPGRYLLGCARRFGILAGTYRDWFSPLFLAALAFGAFRCRVEAAAALLVLIYFFLVHAPMSVNSRYLIETIPAACLLAGCGLAEAARLAAAALGSLPAVLAPLLRREKWDSRPWAGAGLLAACIWAGSAVFLAADLHAAAGPAPASCARVMAGADAPAARGDWGVAERIYSAALRADPECAQAYLSRGVARAKLGRHREAVSDYDAAERIVASDPTLAFLGPIVRSSRDWSYASLGWGSRKRSGL